MPRKEEMPMFPWGFYGRLRWFHQRIVVLGFVPPGWHLDVVAPPGDVLTTAAYFYEPSSTVRSMCCAWGIRELKFKTEDEIDRLIQERIAAALEARNAAQIGS